MSLAQKLLGGALALGAMFLVFTQPKGVAAAASAVRTGVGGTITDITTGKSK